MRISPRQIIDGMGGFAAIGVQQTTPDLVNSAAASVIGTTQTPILPTTSLPSVLPSSQSVLQTTIQPTPISVGGPSNGRTSVVNAPVDGILSGASSSSNRQQTIMIVLIIVASVLSVLLTIGGVVMIYKYKRKALPSPVMQPCTTGPAIKGKKRPRPLTTRLFSTVYNSHGTPVVSSPNRFTLASMHKSVTHGVKGGVMASFRQLAKGSKLAEYPGSGSKLPPLKGDFPRDVENDFWYGDDESISSAEISGWKGMPLVPATPTNWEKHSVSKPIPLWINLPREIRHSNLSPINNRSSQTSAPL